MDKLLETVILGLPNFAGLVLVLFWQKSINDRLLARIEELTDELRDCYKENARGIVNK